MRRVLVFVLVILALWLPQARASERHVSQATDRTPRTSQPAVPDLGPQIVAVSPGAWQARPAQDVLAPKFSPLRPDGGVTLLGSQARFQLDIPPPRRSLPLLI